MNTAIPIKHYISVGSHTAAYDAHPHRLVGMLFEGARDRVLRGRGHAERGAKAERTHCVRSAMLIVDTLRMSLDRERGGQIAENLDELYDYINRRLLEANISEDTEALETVTEILTELESGWRAIESDVVVRPI